MVLSLSDVNDQPPEFTSPPEGFILENQPANTVVMAVSTRNLDEAEYFLSKIGESGGVRVLGGGDGQRSAGRSPSPSWARYENGNDFRFEKYQLVILKNI